MQKWCFLRSFKKKAGFTHIIFLNCLVNVEIDNLRVKNER